MKEITIDYTKTKDAYDGNRETSAYLDSQLPPAKNPSLNSYDDDNIPEVDLPKKADTNTVIPDEVPQRNYSSSVK